MNASRTHATKGAGILFAVLLALLSLLAFLLLLAFLAPARAEESAQAASAQGMGKPFVPMLIDPERRIEKKDLPRGTRMRFVTEEDYPPFNYIGRDGQLAGFNVDLARAICAELAVPCTLQARQWSLLLPALDKGEADAVIASHRLSPDLRRTYAMSLPTFRAPARFVARKAAMPGGTAVAALAGKAAAVVGGTAHEAWLNTLFPGLRLLRFETQGAALEALRGGQADVAFGDGVALAFWLNGAASADCCAFLGGPFAESRFFGEGSGIVLRADAADMRQAVDYALWRLNRDRRYERLYLKHFPVSPW